MSNNRDTTFAIIKGPSVHRGHAAAIINRIRQDGFEIHHASAVSISEDQLNRLYAEHINNPYYPACKAVMGGTMGCIAFYAAHPEGDSVARLRKLLGGSSNAAACTPGSIREEFGGFRFGSDPLLYADNAVHASDSDEAVVRESGIFFGNRLLDATPPAEERVLPASDMRLHVVDTVSVGVAEGAPELSEEVQREVELASVGDGYFEALMDLRVSACGGLEIPLENHSLLGLIRERLNNILVAASKGRENTGEVRNVTIHLRMGAEILYKLSFGALIPVIPAPLEARPVRVTVVGGILSDHPFTMIPTCLCYTDSDLRAIIAGGSYRGELQPGIYWDGRSLTRQTPAVETETPTD